MLNPMGEDIAALFDRAGCTGQLCVLSLDGTQQPRISRWPATSDRPSPGSWSRPTPAPTGRIPDKSGTG
jgi:hypothetical protein